MLSKKDLIILLKANDSLFQLDNTLITISGSSLSEGKFKDLTMLSNVIANNVHPSWLTFEEELINLINNPSLSAEQKADILYESH